MNANLIIPTNLDNDAARKFGKAMFSIGGGFNGIRIAMGEQLTGEQETELMNQISKGMTLGDFIAFAQKLIECKMATA